LSQVVTGNNKNGRSFLNDKESSFFITLFFAQTFKMPYLKRK